VIGYGQWQTTDKTGPPSAPNSAARYKVNALGFATNVITAGAEDEPGLQVFQGILENRLSGLHTADRGAVVLG
jgi:hypothetical protein